MTYQALIFDLGGVVLESPFHVIQLFAKQSQVAPEKLLKVLKYSAAGGAWAKLERGELTREGFASAIEADGAQNGIQFSGMGLLEAFDKHITLRPQVLEAIRGYRKRGLKVAALTNNWPTTNTLQVAFESLVEEFDVFVESWKVGARKPELPIYERVLEELNVEPSKIVFLDDLGENLKPARAMGITTVKVASIDVAMRELADLLS